MATPIGNPRELLLHQLRTMLWVELTLAEEVLPELYEGVHAADLKWALERHTLETEQHVKSLRHVFSVLQAPGDPEESPGLKGLLQEHHAVLGSVDRERRDLVDLVHADSIARSEHLEIAAYSGLVHLAQALGLPHDVVTALRENMGQEELALEHAERAQAKLLAEKVESS